MDKLTEQHLDEAATHLRHAARALELATLTSCETAERTALQELTEVVDWLARHTASELVWHRRRVRYTQRH